jgi:SAM-dependent methyltransferase
MHSLPLDWLVCPVTHQLLRHEGDWLVSSGPHKYPYQAEFNFWDMVPYQIQDLKSPLWKTWNALQENGKVSYQEDPTKNLGVGARQEYLQFKDFVNYQGRILDVGVGPQKAPSHVEYGTPAELENFVGIDPLTGDNPKQFKFVKGLGEYLPFRDNFFDKTLFVTSLDHFVSPSVALTEARRVMKTDGEICVWLGEKSKDAPKPIKSAPWYESLTVPKGAEDRFHMKRFGFGDFMEMIDALNLRLTEHVCLKQDEWRSNHFIRLSQ